MLLCSVSTRVHKFDDLAKLGAPEKPGIFEAEGDWRDALHAVAAHRLALVDPVSWPLLPVTWWSLERDSETGGYRGPGIYFDPDAIEAPQLPAGGMTIGETVAHYLAGAPIAVPPVTGRIAVRSYYADVSPIWRRRIAERPPAHPVQLQAWLARQRALPAPERLAAWYRRVRSEQWRRIALHRFFQDLADGEIVAWSGTEQVPDSWWSSAIEIDLAGGALFSAAGARIAGELAIYKPGERPAALVMRQTIPAGADKQAVADALIAQHRAELEPLTREDQADFVLSRLIVGEALVRERLQVAFGRLQGGPKRTRHIVDTAIAEHHSALAGLASRTAQAAYLAERLPEMKKHAILSGLKDRFGRAPPGFATQRWTRAA